MERGVPVRDRFVGVNKMVVMDCVSERISTIGNRRRVSPRWTQGVARVNALGTHQPRVNGLPLSSARRKMGRGFTRR